MIALCALPEDDLFLMHKERVVKGLTKSLCAVLENILKIIEKVWGTGRRPFREPLKWFEKISTNQHLNTGFIVILGVLN